MKAYSGNDYRDLPSAKFGGNEYKVQPVIVIEENIGHGRAKIRVVNIETGEILLKKYEQVTPELFPESCNAFAKEVMFSRDTFPNGAEIIYIKDIDTGYTYFSKVLSIEQKRFGEKKGTGLGRGRTRGKPKHLRISEESICELQRKLDDNNIGFLFRLATQARWDNGLLSKRNKPLSRPDIFSLMGVPERTGERRLCELMQAGVVTKETDGYHIHRKYITKG